MANLANQFSTGAQQKERRLIRAGVGIPGQAIPPAIPSQLPTTQGGELAMMMSALRSPTGGSQLLTQQAMFPGRRGKRTKGLSELSPEFNTFMALLQLLKTEFRT